MIIDFATKEVLSSSLHVLEKKTCALGWNLEMKGIRDATRNIVHPQHSNFKRPKIF